MQTEDTAEIAKKHSKILIIFALVLVTAAVYFPTHKYDFALVDDHGYVSQNPVVLSGLSWENIKWAFTTTAMANWHPLTWLSYMADSQVFGLNPGAFHVVNVLLHILSTLTLFLALERLTQRRWESAFVAALFALHPLHVESVCWISERKDVLSALFMWLAIGAYARYVQSTRRIWLAIVTLMFLLGLLSKPMLVTLPCVLLLLDYWPLKRLFCQVAPRVEKRKNKKDGKAAATVETGTFRLNSTVLFEKIPLFALALASCIMTLYAQGGSNAMQTLTALSYGQRVVNALAAYGQYIFKTFVPVGLSPFYPIEETNTVFPQAAAALVFIGSVSAATWVFRKKHPFLLVGWLWFLGTLVPVIGIIQVGPQAMADRYMYVSAVGLFIMIAWGVPAIVPAIQRKGTILAVAGTIAILACAALSAIQVTYWKDGVAGYERVVKLYPNSDSAHCNLGIGLQRQGRLDEAAEHLEATIRMTPEYADAHFFLGLARQQQKRIAEAEQHYREALKHMRGMPNEGDTENNLGAVLSSQGKLEEAATHFKRACQVKPGFADAHFNLGNMLYGLGCRDEAIEEYRKALAINPGHPYARKFLDKALADGKK